MSPQSIREFLEFALKFRIWRFYIDENLEGVSQSIIDIIKLSEDKYLLSWYNKHSGIPVETYTINRDWTIKINHVYNAR